MFLFTWYHSLHASTLRIISKRKDNQRKKFLIKQRGKALEEVQHLGRFSYWPVAKINVKAPVTNLLTRKKIIKPIAAPTLVTPISRLKK